jgi:uncharacterized protein involved in outer membrane biogenesis
VAFALAGLVILFLLAAGAGALWLSRADLKPIIEHQASAALGRRVTLGSFQVRWGNPLGIDLSDLAIANAPWGSKPEMVRIGRLSALVDLPALLHGVLRYQRLRISDADVVLERDDKGKGNWKFGLGGGGLGLVPKNRTQFPTLIDFAGERGLVTYRTRSGKVLRIALDRVAIASPSEQTPARLMAEGAYNDVKLRLEANTDSYAALRDAGTPFGARFTLAGRDTDLAFDGTLQEPLDFEGVRGSLSIEARTLDDILGAMGVQRKADLRLSAKGDFRRDHEHWSLAGAKGRFEDSDFSGDVALLEGSAGAPDDLDLDLTIDRLDLNAVAAAFGGGNAAGSTEALPLHPAGLDGMNMTAKMRAGQLALAAHSLREVSLQGRLERGDVTLKQLRFALGGGTLTLSGTLEGTGDEGKGDEGKLALQGALANAEIGQLARELGAGGDQISGRLDGSATLDLRGATLGGALKGSTGAAVLTMHDGKVARSLIERVSVDLRSLFRERKGDVPVACLLGVLAVRDGIGVLSPLRLESRDAVVIGAGKIDFVKGRIELTVKTERDSTSFFALDIPIRISGPFAHVTAQPLVGDDADWLQQPAATLKTLPPALREMANAISCRS